jgi:Respiratory-chain NADH dehydrogenase, 30 Kd subunit
MRGACEQILQPSEIAETCERLMKEGARLQMAYVWFPEPAGPAEIIYLADRGPHEPFSVLRCAVPEESLSLESLATRIPLLGWYEREITDLCGISFTCAMPRHPIRSSDISTRTRRSGTPRSNPLRPGSLSQVILMFHSFGQSVIRLSSILEVSDSQKLERRMPATRSGKTDAWNSTGIRTRWLIPNRRSTRCRSLK